MEETFPPFAERHLWNGGKVTLWLEHLETSAQVVEATTDGVPVLIRSGKRLHLAGWPDLSAARRILRDLAHEAGLDVRDLPDGLRIRDTGNERFVFNYAAEPRSFDDHDLAPAGVLRLTRPS